MAIKLHQVPKEYNATPRRISTLARYITNHLKAQQALAQRQGRFYSVKERDVMDALEGFVDPREKK